MRQMNVPQSAQG